jgi:citrate lyase beta subunit
MDLAEVVLEGKIPGLRSLVVCLEDAVSEHDVPFALQNLSLFLQRLNDAKFRHGDDEWPLVLFAPSSGHGAMADCKHGSECS